MCKFGSQILVPKVCEYIESGHEYILALCCNAAKLDVDNCYVHVHKTIFIKQQQQQQTLFHYKIGMDLEFVVTDSQSWVRAMGSCCPENSCQNI
jgi:hypothetical protein